MAANDMEKSLEDLEKEVTCPICFRHFEDPRILPCCHIFCLGCIHRVALVRGLDKPFQCPVCRCDTVLQDASLENLKKAFFIQTLKALHASMVEKGQESSTAVAPATTITDDVYSSAQVQCELCTSGGKAEYFCSRCSAFICAECKDLHQRVKTYEGHKVLSLKELLQKGIQEVAEGDSQSDCCKDHGKKLTSYCHDCTKLICEKCVSDGHQSHFTNLCSEAGPVCKFSLQASLDPLKEMELNYLRGMETVQTALDVVQECGVGVAGSIEAAFGELHRIIDKRKAQLMEEASRVVQSKASELTSCRDNIASASAEISDVVYHAEQCMRHCSDKEIVSVHSWVKGQVEQCLQNHDTTPEVGTVEGVDLGVDVRCFEDVRRLCLAKAKLIGRDARLTVYVPSKVLLGRQSMAWVDTRTDSEESKSQIPVKCIFRTLHSQFVTTCKIEKNELSKSYIFFTPMVRGRHELSIALDDCDILGSPFSIEVSAHPSHLSKAFNIYSNVVKATAIAVDSRQQIVVAKGEILIQFDSRGIVVWTLNHSKLLISQIYGMAVDNKDNIYCADFKSDRILICNSQGRVETVLIVHTERGLGRQSIALGGEEVMAIERESYGTVLVYDLKFNPVRRIQGNNMGLLQFIACDDDLNVYVTEKGTSSVHVFKPDGEHLRSFGFELDAQNKKLLKEPYSLCVADEYVYVVDVSQHKVVAFTTDGDHVRSLDTRSSGLKNPRGVCVDKDGFLYVLDAGSNDIKKL